MLVAVVGQPLKGCQLLKLYERYSEGGGVGGGDVGYGDGGDGL